MGCKLGLRFIEAIRSPVSDGTTDYVYGPASVPVEQITSDGTTG
ncbi:hypothetical protein [Streptomyces sp. NBC_01262]|nr:hypothetical protein [Streptomyces sp. NBC_01262]